MRRIFRILSSKLDRKLNHPRRARTILRSKVNIYGTIILRVYGEYTITCFLGNFGACANISYQAAFPPPPSRPGYEAIDIPVLSTVQSPESKFAIRPRHHLYALALTRLPLTKGLICRGNFLTASCEGHDNH